MWQFGAGCIHTTGGYRDLVKIGAIELVRNLVAHGDAREGKWRGNWQMEWVASTLMPPPNAVYPALLKLMRTPRLPAVDWTDAPTDLNGLVRFGERRNLVSARVPSRSAYFTVSDRSKVQKKFDKFPLYICITGANKMHHLSISFWNTTLHVSDRLTVHLHEFWYCIHSNWYLSYCYVDCLLARLRWNLNIASRQST